MPVMVYVQFLFVLQCFMSVLYSGHLKTRRKLSDSCNVLSISNDIVSTKIYDERDDFDFENVNFQFLDGDVPRSTS